MSRCTTSILRDRRAGEECDRERARGRRGKKVEKGGGRQRVEVCNGIEELRGDNGGLPLVVVLLAAPDPTSVAGRANRPRRWGRTFSMMRSKSSPPDTCSITIYILFRDWNTACVCSCQKRET
eukprot:2475731-Rhodomonas_salina.1